MDAAIPIRSIIAVVCFLAFLTSLPTPDDLPPITGWFKISVGDLNLSKRNCIPSSSSIATDKKVIKTPIASVARVNSFVSRDAIFLTAPDIINTAAPTATIIPAIPKRDSAPVLSDLDVIKPPPLPKTRLISVEPAVICPTIISIREIRDIMRPIAPMAVFNLSLSIVERIHIAAAIASIDIATLLMTLAVAFLLTPLLNLLRDLLIPDKNLSRSKDRLGNFLVYSPILLKNPPRSLRKLDRDNVPTPVTKFLHSLDLKNSDKLSHRGAKKSLTFCHASLIALPAHRNAAPTFSTAAPIIVHALNTGS